MFCVSCCYKKKLKIPNDNDSWNPIYHKTLHKSYLYNFADREIIDIKKSTTIMISSFGPTGLKQCYDFVSGKKIINEYYVMCPVYWSFDVMMDTQLAVTGSCFINENKTDCVAREVAEELGVISPQYDGLFEIHSVVDSLPVIKSTSNYASNLVNPILKTTDSIKFIDVTYYSYVLDVSNGRAYDSKRDIFASGRDDKSKKIQVVVIGKLDKLLNIINCISDRPHSTDSDSIKSIRLLSLREFF